MGWLSERMFQVTGWSGRASGYGAPAIPPEPNSLVGPDVVAWLPLGVGELLPHAASTAAAGGRAIPASAAFRRSSLRLNLLSANPVSSVPSDMLVLPFRASVDAFYTDSATCATEGGASWTSHVETRRTLGSCRGFSPRDAGSVRGLPPRSVAGFDAWDQRGGGARSGLGADVRRRPGCHVGSTHL